MSTSDMSTSEVNTNDVNTNKAFLPTRPPKRSMETAAFWDACAQRRFTLPFCDACNEAIWYPRAFCPHCGTPSVTYRDVSGDGSIYSFTVVRRGAGPYRESAPYVVAFVTLAEGPTIMTNIINVSADEIENLQIGQKVRVAWDPAGDDGNGNPTDYLPRFAPTR